MTGVAKRSDPRPLDTRVLTYSEVGATAVADESWRATPEGLRRHEHTVSVPIPWADARALVMHWAVKTRSGFEVVNRTHAAAREGADLWLRFAIGPFAVREPIRVIAVIDDQLRCGFAYGTLDGHPALRARAEPAGVTPR